MKTSIILNNVTKMYESPLRILREKGFLNSDSALVENTSLKNTSDIKNKAKALDDISLNIQEGERLGIIGDNGAGKSTLLSIISGIMKPSSGEIKVQGKVNAILTIGLGLREDFTGRENFYLCGEMLGKSRNQVEVDMAEMIEFSELGEFIDQPVRIYSTGMKAKLAFTTTVFIQPEILILDEVLSVGDRWFSEKASRKMRQLCETGKILIFVSHSLGTIVDMCTRCIWLSNGKIIREGSPKEVTDEYRAYIQVRNEEKMKLEFSAPTNFALNSGKIFQNYIMLINNEENKQELIRDNDYLSLRVNLTIIDFIISSKLIFKLERLDGLIVVQNELHSFNKQDCGKTVQVKVDCGQLKLRTGYYKCTFILMNDDEILDEICSIVHLTSSVVVMGGNPALHWPIKNFSTKSNVIANKVAVI